MTNQQIIQKFLKGATSGRNKGGSLFIEENTLYSYGKHYPLARRDASGFWVNNERYSQTTSKQASQVRSAIIRLRF